MLSASSGHCRIITSFQVRLITTCGIRWSSGVCSARMCKQIWPQRVPIRETRIDERFGANELDYPLLTWEYLVGRRVLDSGTLGLKVQVKSLRSESSRCTTSQNRRVRAHG